MKLYQLCLLALFPCLGIAQNFTYSENDRYEIRQRLFSTVHQDNMASLGFYMAESKENILPNNIKIFEIPQNNFDASLQNQSKNSISTEKNKKNSIPFQSDGKNIKFQVKQGFEYKIEISDAKYKPILAKLNWRELAQNNEVKLPMEAKHSLLLSGDVIVKKITVKLGGLVMNFTDKQSKESFPVIADATGHFAIEPEIGHTYAISYQLDNKNIDGGSMSIPFEAQDFEDVLIKNTDFDIFISVPLDANDISLTPKLKEENNIGSKPAELQKYFFGDDISTPKAGKIVALSNYSMDYETFQFSDNCKKEMDALINLMRFFPDMKIALKIYSDSRGEFEYNKRFTLDIAEKYGRYMKARGIDNYRIVKFGMGETHIANACIDGIPCTQEKHLQNRRAEFQILK